MPSRPECGHPNHHEVPTMTDTSATLVSPPPLPVLLSLLPGLGLAASLAGAAMAIRLLPGMAAFSPAILAIVLGIVARQIFGLPMMARAGLGVAMRTLLRLAVMLLGLQVTLGQVAALGLPAVAAVACGLLCCLGGTVWLGARMGIEPKLARLIGTGTAVCGASAVIAANSVTKGDDEDVAYALATVTILGTIAMLAQPAAALLLGLSPAQAGLWLGASIHEVAQVVGAATQLGDDAVRTATIAKMARILMLAPLVLAMATFEHHRNHDAAEPKAKLPIPWFVFGFLLLAAVNSSGIVPPLVIKHSGITAGWMLAAALGAMGFGIDLAAIRRKGIRPLILAVASWAIIGGVSLGLTLAIG